MMLLWLFLLDLLVSSSSSGEEHNNPNRNLIIGGQEAIEGRFSFAEISLQLGRSHQCGGTLIAPDIILTAAHCESWIDTAHIHRYDFKDSTDVYIEMDPVFIDVHPDFNPTTFEADFAIVVLQNPIPSAQTVLLNTDSSIPTVGDELMVLGWGAINISDHTNTIYPSRLQKARINYITNEECEQAQVLDETLYSGEIFDSMLCATSPGIDACRGDSGGPLLRQDVLQGEDIQVGIVSWGRGCALYPGVYSRISDGYDWIREQVCLHSAFPPTYMNCLDSERDPKFWSSNPNVAFQQNIPTVAPAHLGKDIEPSSTRIDVEISIQLDLQSHETSWSLSDNNGNVLINVPYGTYRNLPAQSIDFTIRVNEGSELLFVIKDEAFNGMGIGYPGWYKIFLVSETERIEILSGDGEYGRAALHRFTANMSSYRDETIWKQPIIQRGDILHGETMDAGVFSGVLPDNYRDQTSRSTRCQWHTGKLSVFFALFIILTL